MDTTLTLLMYWTIALCLVFGGIYSLKKGFQLVTYEISHQHSSSSIEFLGLKASVNSIGALVMITAFMWGWAASSALPEYNDGKTQIAALQKQLSDSKGAMLANEDKEITVLRQKIADMKDAMLAITDKKVLHIPSKLTADSNGTLDLYHLRLIKREVDPSELLDSDKYELFDPYSYTRENQIAGHEKLIMPGEINLR